MKDLSNRAKQFLVRDPLGSLVQIGLIILVAVVVSLIVKSLWGELAAIGAGIGLVIAFGVVYLYILEPLIIKREAEENKETYSDSE